MAQHVGRTRQQDGKKTGQAARRTGAPKRWALATVHSTTKPRKGRLSVAPMSRVHDKADKRVSGKWVGRSFGVGREAKCSGSRRPLKWWELQ